MKVRYLRKGEYQGADMTLGTVYEVLGIEADSFRIINERGMPYLYDPDQFEIVDRTEPTFWVTEYGGDGERYSYPPKWNHPGFFEDFHDDNETAIHQFWADCERLYGIPKRV